MGDGSGGRRDREAQSILPTRGFAKLDVSVDQYGGPRDGGRGAHTGLS